MATFPSIEASFGFTKNSQPNTRIVKYADGYEHRILFGLASHQNPETYNLTWQNITETESDVIEAFLRTEANNSTSFTYSPPSEGFTKTAEQCQDAAIEMFERAATEEKEWASYLFKDGSIIGLNEAVLHQYIDWLCMSRRKTIGLPYENVGKNPIAGWTESWMKSDSVQVAPQEHEITSYKIGASTNDLDDMDLDFEL